MRSLSQAAEMLYISAVIVAEIRLDIARVAEPGRRIERNDWFKLSARPVFERGVRPVSEGNMLHWRLPTEEGRRIGQTISQRDLMIVATALEYGPAIGSSVTWICEKARVLAALERPATARL